MTPDSSHLFRNKISYWCFGRFRQSGKISPGKRIDPTNSPPQQRKEEQGPGEKNTHEENGASRHRRGLHAWLIGATSLTVAVKLRIMLLGKHLFSLTADHFTDCSVRFNTLTAEIIYGHANGRGFKNMFIKIQFYFHNS